MENTKAPEGAFWQLQALQVKEHRITKLLEKANEVTFPKLQAALAVIKERRCSLQSSLRMRQ